MPETITRDEVERLLSEEAQVVDVLSGDAFDELHIVGAVGIPLRELGGRAGSELDAARPVITYCNDFL